MTVDLAAARAAVSARNRREFHQARLADAAAGRDQLWAAAGWLVSEAVQLPPHERDEVLARLLAIATDLNRRYQA